MSTRFGLRSGRARAKRVSLLCAGASVAFAASFMPAPPCDAAREYSILVDGKPVDLSAMSPIQVGGRVLVPLRGILERAGASVVWSPEKKVVTARRGATAIELPVGGRTATVNGRSAPLDVPAMIMKGAVMVPLRFVAESLGVSVQESRGQIRIATRPAKAPLAPVRTAAVAKRPKPRVSPPTAASTQPVLAPATPTPRPAGTGAGRRPAVGATEAASSQTVAGTVEAVNSESTPQTITILADDRSVEYSLAAGVVVLSRAGNTSQESNLKEVYPGDRVLGKRDTVSGKITILVVQYDQAEGDVQAIAADVLGIKDAEPITLGAAVPVVLADGTHGTWEGIHVGDTVRVRLRQGARVATLVTVLKAAPAPATRAAEETPAEAKPAEPAAAPAAETATAAPAGQQAETKPAEPAAGTASETAAAAQPAASETKPPAAPELKVTSFTHDAKASLRAGSVLTVTLEGDAGAAATFNIGTMGQELAMQETAPGKYVGTFTIPEGVNAKVSVFGKLAKEGKESPLVQAGAPVFIDAVPPTVSDVEPAREALVPNPQPMIYAVFEDTEGSAVNPDQVKLLVGGEDVTAQATRTPRFILYRPILPFANGPVTVRVALQDCAGNQAANEWQFTVNAPEVPISSVAHNATRPIDVGQGFTVTVAGKPRGTASFSIGTMKSGIVMNETAPGIYQGRYTAERGDVAIGARIVAQLVTETGEQFTRECSEPITILTVAPRTPTVTSPSEDEVFDGPVIVTGKAQPGVTVRVQVVRKGRTLGLWSDSDVVAAQEVKVDNDGAFTTTKLQVPRGRGKAEQMTIQAVAIDPVGHRSEVVSVKVKFQ